jgi:hypothetical protein
MKSVLDSLAPADVDIGLIAAVTSLLPSPNELQSTNAVAAEFLDEARKTLDIATSDDSEIARGKLLGYLSRVMSDRILSKADIKQIRLRLARRGDLTLTKDDSGGVKQLPYREGEPSPAGNWILTEMIDDDGKSLGLSWADPTTLKDSGEFQHEEIEHLLPMCRWAWRHLRRHLTFCNSFEDWERGFLQDAHPDKEVAIWVKYTYTYLEFRHKFPESNKDVVFSAIMSISQGRADEIKPRSAAKAIMKVMRGIPKYVKEAKSFTADGHLKTNKKYLR